MSTIERYRARLRDLLGEGDPRLEAADRLLVDAMSEAYDDGYGDNASDSEE